MRTPISRRSRTEMSCRSYLLRSDPPAEMICRPEYVIFHSIAKQTGHKTPLSCNLSLRLSATVFAPAGGRGRRTHHLMPPGQRRNDRNDSRGRRSISDANTFPRRGPSVSEGQITFTRVPKRVPLDPPKVGGVGLLHSYPAASA